MNMIKKSAYPMSSPQHSVGAGVGFDTGKGREGTQELPGRSVTRTKQILKADKNTTEGRDSGAAGQICNTSKTYKKLILIHVSGTEQICNTGKTNFKIR